MVDLNLTRLTELQAVNIMLEAVSEQPVSSLDTSLSVATLARQKLHDTSREVQSLGLLCNTKIRLKLLRDGSNNIVLGTDVLRVEAHYPSDLVCEREGKMYDLRENTFVFQNDLYVDQVNFLAWTDLPQVVRWYITVRATKLFQSKYLGSDVVYKFTEQEELDAWRNLVTYQIDAGNYNIIEDAPDGMSRLYNKVWVR